LIDRNPDISTTHVIVNKNNSKIASKHYVQAYLSTVLYKPIAVNEKVKIHLVSNNLYTTF